MTTREENIKKINAELEKLSDEELDKVAGGDELVLDGVASRFYARSIGGDGVEGFFSLSESNYR